MEEKTLLTISVAPISQIIEVRVPSDMTIKDATCLITQAIPDSSAHALNMAQTRHLSYQRTGEILPLFKTIADLKLTSGDTLLLV